VLLVAGFVVLVLLVGWAIQLLMGFGIAALIFALLFAGGVSAVGYWKSDSIALAMSHARPADPTTHARLHNLVEGLCIAAGLPKPRIYVIEDDAPNAFATGRDPRHAAVAVTTGLLEKLTRIELEGVLAHELSHIKNYDILVSTLAVTLVGVAALLSDFSMRFLWWGGPRHRDDSRGGSGGGPVAVLAVFGFVLLLVAPLVAKVMQATISRRRETLADVSGVALTRYPPGLISALEKLRDDTTVVHSSSRATAHLWVESPLARTPEEGRRVRLNRLFDTHPPLEERIQALKEL
jgi:heat shock protein HtpX